LSALAAVVLAYSVGLASFRVAVSAAERAPAVVENPGLEGADGSWPRFRGPNGTGISFDQDIPVRWTESDFLWKVTLPGIGHSSPCVWGDRLFVCTASDDGLERSLVCLDALTGETRWTSTLRFEIDKRHDKNSFASCTPATDGERVYVAFSSTEQYSLLAFDFEGAQVWRYELGPYQSQHGSGTSPMVFEDLVYLGNDQDGPSSIVAVDCETGKERWKLERAADVVSYSTPFILQRPGVGPEVVFSSKAEGLAGLDARTGAPHWKTGPFADRTVSSAAYRDGIVFQTSGGAGTGKYMVAVRPGGASGSTNDLETLWTRNRTLPYVPSPIAFGDHVYLWGDNGVVSCLVAGSGENVWTERVGGMFSGSPVCVDGKLYCISEEGEVVVVAASPEFKLIARNPLGEASHSTPAVARGRMYLRTFHQLICVGKK
jgi:outer membrane protein assembly factor BamB